MKLGFVVAVLLLAGWSQAHPQKPRGHRANHNKAERPVDKFNYIDLEILKVTAEHEDANIVLAPASVKTTLSMLWEGADGKSAEEIGHALRLKGRRDAQEETLHRFQHSLVAPHNSTQGSTLEVASRVFVSDRVEISPSYSDALSHYRAVAQTVNMSDPDTAASIVNKWVNTSTHGLVPTLVQPESLSGSPVMVLANAIYFQGRWKTAFDPKLTEDACFFTDPTPSAPYGECLMVKMMETMGTFRTKLIQDLDATLLVLPYDDGRYSMAFLLPERRDGIQQLMRDLLFADLPRILNTDLEDSEYSVSIPKFTIEYSTDLVPVLHKLSVEEVFSANANLTRMVKQDKSKVQPSVSNVFHKAKILVDEKGAVAAGVSGALVVPLMGGPQPRFRADHPFLFFIRDNLTGGFLFSGRVSRPQASSVIPLDSPTSVPLPVPSTTSKRSSTEETKDDGVNFPATKP